METKSVLETLPKWVRNNWFYRADLRGQSSDGPDMPSPDKRYIKASPAQANLVSSIAVQGDTPQTTIHYPVLDIDFEIATLPSSTDGHFHLYLGKGVDGVVYERLLTALYDAGIIQQGILNQFKRHGATCARLPHVKKGSPEDAGGFEEPGQHESGGWGQESNSVGDIPGGW